MPIVYINTYIDIHVRRTASSYRQPSLYTDTISFIEAAAQAKTKFRGGRADTNNTFCVLPGSKKKMKDKAEKK